MKKPAALVIESRPNMREFVATLLEETGYDVLVAETLEDGLLLFDRRAEISLLFADVAPRRLAPCARALSRGRPWMQIIVPCGEDETADLPGNALRLKAKWCALDLLIEAERARRQPAR